MPQRLLLEASNLDMVNRPRDLLINEGYRSLNDRGLSADPNDRNYLEVEVPAGNGVGTARAIARAYSCFAEGGTELRITPETFALIAAPPVVSRPVDEVLGVPSYFSLGFLRPGPDIAFGSSPRAFGAPGAGGSFAFADPDVRLGYEQAGLLLRRRSAREGIARRGVPRDRTPALKMTSDPSPCRPKCLLTGG